MTRSRNYFRAIVRGSLAAALLGLTACGGGSTDQSAVLNVGDQSKLLQLALERSGEARNSDTKLQWTTFTDGPHMNAAFLAGAIDLGWMGDTPAILAAAAKADVVVIAGASHAAGSYYQIVAPPGSPIKKLSDLRGKRVAFTRGTALQGFLLTALHSVGLKQSDIRSVDLPAVSLGSALKSGGTDAAILVGPALTGYLSEHPAAVQIKASNGGYNVLLARRAALSDPVKRRLIEDFLGREARAWRWTEANTGEWQDILFKQVFHQGPESLKLLKARGATLKLVGPVTGEMEQSLKAQARLLAESRVLPDASAANSLFDPQTTEQFNAVIDKAGT